MKQHLGKGPLIVTIKVIPIADTKYVTISFIKPDPIRHLVILAITALEPTIDDVGDDTVARDSPGRHVSRRR